MPRTALVLRHTDGDHAGAIGDRLEALGLRLHYVDMHRGGVLPALDSFDLMLALGGPQQVWQEAEHPWLIEEKAAIRDWVARRAKPYIGICFGHQLLATALGGEVGYAAQPEIGLHAVDLADDDDPHSFLHGLEGRHPVMQWHSAEVKRLPQGARVLGSSATTPVQAMAVGDHALGVQFHFEWTLSGVRGWAAHRNWIEGLERELGEGAHARICADLAAREADVAAVTHTVFGNFRKASGL
jgi:GMP synthase-like glutamine amidotransferase